MRLSVILIITCVLACSKQDAQEALRKENEALKKENTRLKNKQRIQDASISGYRRTLEEIDFNLKKIELNWSLINEIALEEESHEAVESRIKSRIMYIDNLFGNTNLKIQLLDKNLNSLRKDSENKSDEILSLDRSLKSSARILMEKEEEYRRKKEALELEVGDLEKLYLEQKAYTDQIKQILNRAYYYFGSNKELKSSKIVDEKGGFIGIGRVKVLNAQMDNIGFQEIEKDKTNYFTIKSNKVKLITTHPKNSYRLDHLNGSTKLTILDMKKFWKTGNYLIIQTN